MSNLSSIIRNVIVRQDALDAASSGNVAGIVIVIVYLLLAVTSVVALAVVIERAVRLRRGRLMDAAMRDALPRCLASGDVAGAIQAADDSRSMLGKALTVELTEFRDGHISIEEAIETADDMVDDGLNANLDILSSVATTAPLLGLLGTVLGMMLAFSQLDVGTRKETLAHGITTALDTTVRGLIIAIFCLTAEGVFARHIDKVYRTFGSFFTSVLRAARRGQASPGDAA